jgi:cytochrome c biogenesis protein CcdA/thiol-disulfide isomerase/thioredoxin
MARAGWHLQPDGHFERVELIADPPSPVRDRPGIEQADMDTLVLIGFLGGLITGISPCILPVLPVIFFAGTPGVDTAAAPASSRHDVNSSVAVVPTRTRSETLRPYRVIAGLVVSFSVFTLAGTALLSLLHLPQDAIRWAGLAALTLIGLGLIFPRVQHYLELPFARIPQWNVTQGKGGFGLGLAVGVLYVPCAGPVLAAIIVAGATGNVGLRTIALTLAFAIGATLPLLVFALAGQQVAHRIGVFRRRQRLVRVVGGVVMIVFAVALVFDLPAGIQRAIPDYTAALQGKVVDGGQALEDLASGTSTPANAELANCDSGGAELENCGAAPDISGATGWLNTPGSSPIDFKALHGKVVLVDFWAYSCINCQRAIPHVVDWYKTYKDAGFEVIGVHTPEYAFEHVPENVTSGAAGLGITYPVALDNDYSIWDNFHNQAWPAEYLIDANGTIRHIAIGEGEYDVTEGLIRQLLTAAHPGVALPSPTTSVDTTPTGDLTPETYLGVDKAHLYQGTQAYATGAFDYPTTLPDDGFALRGRWTLDDQGATAQADDAGIELNYHAKDVYLVVGGTGTVTTTRSGETTTTAVSGPPTLHEIVTNDPQQQGHLDIHLSQGLQAFSFTYG